MKLLFLAPNVKASLLPKFLAAYPRDVLWEPVCHDVRVAVPLAGAAKSKPVLKVAVPTVYGPRVADVYAAKRGGVVVYAIAVPRRRRGIPAFSADEQVIFFSLAAVALCRALDWAPDVLHALDPSFGAAIYWLATDGLRDDTLGDIATVLSVGDVRAPWARVGRVLSNYGLVPSDAPHLPDAAREALLGLGLAHADLLLTSSPAHARHLQTPAGGGDFAELLLARRDRLAGVIPGLDLAAWDPAHDPALPRRYDEAQLDKRAANKRALQHELKLSAAKDTPLFAVLAERESPASLAVALPALRQLLAGGADVQVALVGPSAPEAAAELKALAQDYRGQVAVTRRRDAGLVRRVYAGADVLVAAAPDSANTLPTRRALRYGAVPVSHSHGCGDPDDGVVDAQHQRLGTGFVFRDYNSNGLLATLQRARRAYGRPTGWPRLQRRGRQAAAQWGKGAAAEAYLALYQQAILVRKETREQLAGVLAEIPASG